MTDFPNVISCLCHHSYLMRAYPQPLIFLPFSQSCADLKNEPWAFNPLIFILSAEPARDASELGHLIKGHPCLPAATELPMCDQ